MAVVEIPDVGADRPAHLRLLLINSVVAFAIALPVMITLHELGHALAGVAQGLQPTVFPGQVTYTVPGTTSQQILRLLSGPAFSLLLGIGLLGVARTAGRGFGGLFLLWLGALSVQEFTGYLMTAPFLAIGDIGSALRLLAAPGWAYWLVLLAGAAGTVLLGRHFTRSLVALTDPAAGDVAAQLRRLGLFAWLIGSAVTLAASLVASPGGLFTPVGLVEALATLTSGIFVFGVRLFMGAAVPPRPATLGWTPALIGVALWLAVTVLRAAVLGPGLRL